MPGSRGDGRQGRGGGGRRGKGGGGSKHVQKRNMRQALPDSQAYPEATRHKFASLVKVFFGMIQCLHHGHIIDGQRQGRNSAKAFQAKVKELNSFVRPARSGPWVQAEIVKINENWASQVSDALAQHYKKALDNLLVTAKGLVIGLDWPRALQIAETWAQRNYRKKLTSDVLKSVRDMVKELTTFDPLVDSATVPSQLRKSPHGNGTWVTVSGNAKTSSTPTAKNANAPNSLTTPKKANNSNSLPKAKNSTAPSVSLSNRFSPLASNPITTKSFYSQPTPSTSSDYSEPIPSTSSASPSYALAVRKRVVEGKKSKTCTPQDPARSSSPKGASPKVGGAESRATPNQRFTAERTLSKNKVWRLPAIPDTIETLIVGTSNIGRITKSVDSTTALWSFPGAKFDNFVVLFERARQEGVYEHVKNVILSCGINDRDNKVDVTTFPRYKRACSAIRDLFPCAAVYYVLPNWSDGLPPRAQKNLSELSQMALNEKTGLVHLIPHILSSRFTTIHDNVHWTETTANWFLDHWLGFISQPAKNC